MLNINKWTSSVKPFYEQNPKIFVTTLQFGDHKTELANVEELAIKFNKSGNEEDNNFFIPSTLVRMSNPVKCFKQFSICQLQKIFMNWQMKIWIN